MDPLTNKKPRLICLCHRQHVFDTCRGGRPRARHSQALRITQLNPTSVQKHFNSIASIEGEILALTETKAADLDQHIITRRCRAHRLQVLWGEPVGTVGTIAGRSGGVAIIVREGWHLRPLQPHLELEAAPRNWIAARAVSKDGQCDVLVMAYYGHPESYWIRWKETYGESVCGLRYCNNPWPCVWMATLMTLISISCLTLLNYKMLLFCITTVIKENYFLPTLVIIALRGLTDAFFLKRRPTPSQIMRSWMIITLEPIAPLESRWP